MPSEAHRVDAGDQEARLPAGQQYDPQIAAGAAIETSAGTGEDKARLEGFETGGCQVRTTEILERFQRESVTRFKIGASTPKNYGWMFRRFAEDVQLEAYSKRQLASAKGRELILAHMAKVPLKSRRVVLTGIQCVWESGLGLPWPVNRKRDFGRTLPPPGRRQTPPDKYVQAWAEAVRHEKDPYLKAMVLLTMQYGWRPENELGRLRRRHLRYDASGKLHAVVADATDADFKGSSPIVAWLTPDAVDALDVWLTVAPNASPEDPILPWRGKRGDVQPKRVLKGENVRGYFEAFARKWSLPRLMPV